MTKLMVGQFVVEIYGSSGHLYQTSQPYIIMGHIYHVHYNEELVDKWFGG